MIKAGSTRALLFMEGRSIPFVSITVTSTAGSAPTASVELVPLNDCKHFLPRTSVAIFVVDESYPGTLKPWVLLFDGELLAIQFYRNTEARSFRFSAVGTSNYWDLAKQFYLNTSAVMGRTVSPAMANLQQVENQKEAEIQARQQSAVTHTYVTTTAYITSKVLGEMKKGKTLVEAALELVKNVPNVNSLFRYMQQKYRLNDRISFVQSGNLTKLLQIEQGEQFLDSIFGQGGSGEVSIRTLLSTVLSLVFHESSEPLAPSMLVKEGITDGIGNLNQSIASFIYYPESFILPPPKCNILFPEMYGAFGYQRDFLREHTRMMFQPSLSGVQKQSGIPQVFLDTYYSPGGYKQFQYKGAGKPLQEPVQYDAPEGQGNYNDPSKQDNLTNSVLEDFNFLSYEEVMKGIVSTRGGAPPVTSIFTRTMTNVQRKTYFGQLSDYIFYQQRYQSRQAATSGPLNIAPIPGLNMLMLDASETNNHVLGKLQSITHSISSTGGATTQYQMNYIREIDERDIWTGNIVEPPIPPWYDPKVFGTNQPVVPGDYETLQEQNQLDFFDAETLNNFPNVGEYYKKLIGTYDSEVAQGSDSITSPAYPTIMGGTYHLLEEYRAHAQSNNASDYVGAQTRRSYVLLEDYFVFMGARLTDEQKGISFRPNVDTVFRGPVFDGGYVDKAPDTNSRDKTMKPYFGELSLNKRRDPIDAYRGKLSSNVGFRG